MKIKYFQKGFNYSQDGPGNRLVYHLHGCNFRCPWCSNPEGMNAAAVYPAFPVYEADTDTLLAEILSCKPMFFDGGGVTFTGGEVTLQLPAATELFKKLKSNGINTAIETNGSCKDLPLIFPFLDHLIMDIKSTNAQKHLEITGGFVSPVLENLKIAYNENVDTLIHIPLIHGFNDGETDIDGFINALLPYSDRIKVELLSYHEYGKDKWKKCGLEYRMENAFVTDERYCAITEKFTATGITVVRT